MAQTLIQRAYTLLDGITPRKIGISALIALGGVLVVTVPFLSNELIDYIKTGAAIDWKTPLTVLIGGFSTWVVASIREVIKGVDPSAVLPTTGNDVK